MLCQTYTFEPVKAALFRIRSQPWVVIAIGFSRYAAAPASSTATAWSSCK